MPAGNGERPFLTDFGLARAVATGTRLTRTGEILGTPAYMSPEQVRGGQADGLSPLGPASDVWALGCVLYECLAGRRAFDGDTPAAVVGAVLLGKWRLPAHCARAQADVLRVCLAPRATDRYAAAGALRADLQRVLAGARPAHRPPARRRGWVWAGAAAVLLAGAVGLAMQAGAGTGAGAVPTAAPEAEARRLATAAGAVRMSDPAEGARLLGEALAREPHHADWQCERATLLWAVGRWEEARALWDAVPTRAPQWAQARFLRGVEALSRRDADGALPDLQLAAASDGRYARLAGAANALLVKHWADARERLRELGGWEADFLRGLVEESDPAGDHELAARALGAAVTQGMPLAVAYHQRGMALKAMGDLPGAVECWTAAVRLDPTLLLSWHNRGLARREQGDLQGALADLDEVIRRSPGFRDSLSARGHVRELLGDVPGALADYDADVEYHPDSVASYANRAALRVQEDDLPGALADTDAALQRDPDFIPARVTRSTVRARLGDLPGALADLDHVIAREPEHFEARLNRSLLRTTTNGDGTSGALDDAELALRLRPGSALATMARGNARLRLGQAQAACDDYTAALATQPGLTEAHVGRAIARTQLGDLAGAEADYTEVLQRTPDHAQCLTNRGNVRVQRARYAEAQADFEAAIRAAPRLAEPWIGLASAREMAGDMAGAAAAYERFVTMAPQHAAAPEARARMLGCRAQAAESGR